MARPREPPPPFPWDDAMRLGLGVLRLPPRHFWSMTPRELDAALRGALGSPADASVPSRAAFDQLMRRFPDHIVDEPRLTTRPLEQT